MGPSLESERPIMAPSVSSNRDSQRFSTYSEAPSTEAPSTKTTDSQTHRIAEINQWEDGLERLKNKDLEKQRFTATPEKTDHMGKLALGAKLDRALERRLHGQDAVLRKKVGTFNEKVPIE
ncbi:MAG: hypothetical protein M1834_000673 [Cirrosporium novae-zelandiae]|nr:MAG: hypothetical protein M1834_000673 [Cirrosporium novae-zelandiae]